jgi:O-acetyl-ADP-ribose deacetylase
MTIVINYQHALDPPNVVWMRRDIDVAASDGGSDSGKMHAQIEVRASDLLTFDGDGIIVPTISDGLMVEGVAACVKAAAGKEVEDEVRRSAPIAVGAAVVTSGGALSVRHIVHVPLTEHPGMKVGVENIRRATRAGLLASTHFQLERIAIPGFGNGEIGVPCDEAARAIIDEVRAYRGAHPVYVVLLDQDPEMIAAFSEMLGDI